MGDQFFMQLLRIDDEKIFYDIQRRNIHMLSIYKFYLEIKGFQECDKIKNEANEYLDEYFFYCIKLTLGLYV